MAPKPQSPEKQALRRLSAFETPPRSKSSSMLSPLSMKSSLASPKSASRKSTSQKSEVPTPQKNMKLLCKTPKPMKSRSSPKAPKTPSPMKLPSPMKFSVRSGSSSSSSSPSGKAMKVMKKVTKKILENARNKSRFERVMDKIYESWNDVKGYNRSYRVGPPCSWTS